jgi:signal transduction histidine kinase/ActR/RegA family two-component response regulator
LLLRQLRKHAPHLDPLAPEWRAFVAAISGTYHDLQQENAFLSHTLEVASAELTEANERLRRDGERQVASISDYYRQVLDSQQGMIVCVRKVDGEFITTLCRGELARRLGHTPESAEGFPLAEIAPTANFATLHAAYEQAWNGTDTSLTYRHARTGIEVFALMRPRCEHGRVTEVIASCVEITALKSAESELREAKERAEAADRAKSEFLAVMSHEIRTPLNAVLGFASMLRESHLSPEHTIWVSTICTAGESLLTLIDDILDFSKIEAGRLSLLPEPVAVAPLLDAVGSIFQQRALVKGLTLETSFGPGVPAAVLIDPHRLRQVLINLVGNALKFTREGYVRIGVELVAAPAREGEPCTLRFTVADSGIGIPPERQDRLFRPFSQVDSSTTRQFGGTGLGLAISQRLVRLLGGEIGFTSEPGRGSVFHFTVRAPLAALPERPRAAAPAADFPAGAALRILIAEDQLENRMLIEDFLRDRGYAPDVVENGRLAVAAATARTYDLILMDLLMPEVDGLAATQAIRSHYGAGRGPRIVALTANVFPEDRARCRAAGMNGLLAKPIDFKQLLRLLEGEAPGPEIR